MAGPETSQTLDRGLTILALVAERSDGITVGDISEELGLSRTIVYRLVSTLEQHALIRRASDGKCRIGLGMLGLSRHVQPLLRQAAMPALRALAEQTDATAHLTVADGGDGLVIAVFEPPTAGLHVGLRVGSRTPLEDSPAGQAILATRRQGPGESRTPELRVGAVGEGAHGIAASIADLPGLEAAVGVLVLSEPADGSVAAAVISAVGSIAAGLH